MQACARSCRAKVTLNHSLLQPFKQQQQRHNNPPWHTSSVHSVSASWAASLMESGPERAAAASAATHSLATWGG